MTTIAYRNGVMSADSMMVRGDEKCMGAVKVENIGGVLVGYAGSMFDAVKLFSWIRERGFRPEHGPSSDSPVLSEEGTFLMVSDGVIYNVRTDDMVAIPIWREFEAIGSGAEYALGAMAMGAEAEEAVHIAIGFDCLSGGGIRSVEV